MRRLLIVGPPCAGKTTLALQLATPDDLLLDRDLIARRLGSPRHHMHDPAFTRRAEHQMDTALERLTRDHTTSAIIVRSLPRIADQHDLAQRLHAELRLVDPGLHECLHRAHTDNRPRGTITAIKTWYDRNSAATSTPCMDCGRPATSVRCKTCCERLRNGRPWRTLQAQVFAEETHCWICGYLVDQNLPPGHPRSRTVDHLTALRDGGAALDRDNCRLAHRDCNTTRTNQDRATPRTRTTLIVDPTTI